VSAKQVTRTIVFDGAGGRYEVPPEQWAGMLLFLENWGWQPEKQLRMSYLASGIQVSDLDARNLAAIGQRVLDTALKDPAAIYPVSFDMAKLYQFVEFCGAGGFRRSDERVS
jgi:hypothetical protein